MAERSGGIKHPSPMVATRDERKELERFLKFFCLKAIQVVALSRSGHLSLVSTHSDANAQNWFNLNIPESDQVRIKARELLDRQLPTTQLPLVIQVSLASARSSSSKVIEAWKISRTEECEPGAKIVSGVYAKLVLLLKSLLTVSRCTPAYKLCRRHGVALNTEFFYGDVCESLLNDNCEKRRLGVVKTPYGSITVSIFYRSAATMQYDGARVVSGVFEEEETESPVDLHAVSNVDSWSQDHDYIDSSPKVVDSAPSIQPTYAVKPAFARQAPATTDFVMTPDINTLFQDLLQPPSKPQPRQDTSDAPVANKPETSSKVGQSAPQKPPIFKLNPQQSFVIVSKDPAFVNSTLLGLPGQPQFGPSINQNVGPTQQDVHQFFRFVQHAGSLRKTDPQEGNVISHELSIKDYISGFANTGEELTKLVSFSTGSDSGESSTSFKS